MDLEFNYDDTRFYVLLDQHNFMSQLNAMSHLGKHLHFENLRYDRMYFRRPNVNPGDVLLAVREDEKVSLLDAWFDKNERPISEPL